MGRIREPACVFRSDSSELAERALETLASAGVPAAVRAELAAEIEVDEQSDQPLDDNVSYAVLVALDSTSAALEALASAGLPGRLEEDLSPHKARLLKIDRWFAYGTVVFLIGLVVWLVVALLFF